jgi:hypothetical protein
MPMHGRKVGRWDVVRDATTGRRFRVLYVSDAQPPSYYLTSVDNGGQLTALEEQELVQRFEKVEEPPAPGPKG